MADRIEPQPGILDIALYQGGASNLPGRSDVLKLSSNENPSGPSPRAIEALRATAESLHRYPSTDHAGLRAKIAQTHGVDADRVICGAGSDEILSFLCNAYAGPGLEVIHTEHGFAMYRIYALAAGATPVSVPERDRMVDVDAILAAVTPATRLVFVTNPGNPTGTILPLADLERLADLLPPHVILVLDAAYIEYAEAHDGGRALAATRPNVVMTRTFSKLYGLGGLRVGWGFGPREIIDVLNRVRSPFNIGVPQIAAAEAALGDTPFVEASVSDNARNRASLVAALRAMGLACDDSHTNFVLARFASPADAVAAEARFREDGILVRKVGGYGFPEGLRITVPDDAGLSRVLASLHAFTGVPA